MEILCYSKKQKGRLFEGGENIVSKESLQTSKKKIYLNDYDPRLLIYCL